VVARRHSDAAWPKPIWGVTPPTTYDERSVRGLLSVLRRRLGVADL
jgi:diadenosine tetraphosphate (Ap4A) HIT family hydrolase